MHLRPCAAIPSLLQHEQSSSTNIANPKTGVIAHCAIPMLDPSHYLAVRFRRSLVGLGALSATS